MLNREIYVMYKKNHQFKLKNNINQHYLLKHSKYSITILEDHKIRIIFSISNS